MKGNWEFSHPGVFVKDFYRTLDYYKDLGIAVEPYGLSRKAGVSPEEQTQVMMVFGKPRPPADPTKPRFLELLYIGDLEFEILQAPAQRPQGDALAYGEGINHVCFNVPDIDGETEALVDKGLRIIFDLTRDGVRVEDYLDTREFGNIILSLRPLEAKESKARKARLGIVDWKFRGHGVAVSDMDKTIEYYQSLGIAAVRSEVRFDSSSMADVEVCGEAPDGTFKARIRTAEIGPVAYEFIQPLEGDGLYKESLERRGEGIIDITFSVEDLEAETAKLVEKGVEVILSGTPEIGGAFAYFDTREDGGDIMIKLVEAQ